MHESASTSSIKMDFFDVDELGQKYRVADPDNLISGLDRLYHGEKFQYIPSISINEEEKFSSKQFGGIYLGDEPVANSIPFSEYKPPSYESFDDAMPFLAGKMKSPSPVKDILDEKPRAKRTRSVFDDVGIYLGEKS